MYFNAQGDLWIQVGDNVPVDGNPNKRTRCAGGTAGNSANLVGSNLRIHPDNSKKGYSIPKGNYGEHFALLENNPQYMDTVHVKPEIYTKGMRSNFYSTGHPTELIHIWGEIGTKNEHDELNVINKPVYGGWPHIQGDRNSSWTGGTGNAYEFSFDDVPDLNPEKVANPGPFGQGMVLKNIS